MERVELVRRPGGLQSRLEDQLWLCELLYGKDLQLQLPMGQRLHEL